MKPTEWKVYRARRLWALIAANQIGIFALFYWLFGKNAFFLFGPFALYDVVIYFFPHWYQLFLDGPRFKGLKFQQFVREAKAIFPPQVRLDVRFLEKDFSNVLVFAHNRHVWIVTSAEFMEHFHDAEVKLLLEEIHTLWAVGRLQTATLLSALQLTLPFGFWRHNRGTELIFFSQNKDIRWQRLCFKVFHWSDGKGTSPAARRALLPCLAYPALTNYGPSSYFSVYNFLREKLITALKSEETADAK